MIDGIGLGECKVEKGRWGQGIDWWGSGWGWGWGWGQVLQLIQTFILRCLCVCVCVNIFFNYGQAALNPEQFLVGPYNWHYKSHFTLICERKKKRNKEIEREAEAQSKSCGRFTNCWLVAAGAVGGEAGAGKWENGKAANQQNDYPNSPPPSTL